MLAKDLNKLTTKLRFGFGSFVDKPVTPFMRSEVRTTTLCRNENIPYSPPYGFKNHLNLSEDIQEFIVSSLA